MEISATVNPTDGIAVIEDDTSRLPSGSRAKGRPHGRVEEACDGLAFTHRPLVLFVVTPAHQNFREYFPASVRHRRSSIPLIAGR